MTTPEYISPHDLTNSGIDQMYANTQLINQVVVQSTNSASVSVNIRGPKNITVNGCTVLSSGGSSGRNGILFDVPSDAPGDHNETIESH